MPLSKNLYEVQDLAAFLLLSLEKPNIQLASSIVNELLLSLESEIVHKILGFAWLLEQPDKDLTPLRFTAWRSYRYDILLDSFNVEPLTIQPFIPVADYPLPAPSSNSPPREWYARPADWTDDQCGTFYLYIKSALQHKQCWRAYLLARPILNHPYAFRSFLTMMGVSQEILSFAHYPHLHAQILEHSMYILAHPPQPMEIMIHQPQPQGRVLHIHQEARNRWNVPPTPPTKLIGQPNFIFEDTPYWNEQRNNFAIDLDTKGRIKYESDRLYEEFFKYNFPYDIPDEWSVAERDKSHPSVIQYQPETNPWAETFHQLILPTPVTVSR